MKTELDLIFKRWPLKWTSSVATKLVIRFRKCSPRIRHLGILTILSYRRLRQGQKEKGHAALLPPLIFFVTLKQVIKASCAKGPPYTWREGASSSLKTKEAEKKPTNRPREALLVHCTLLMLYSRCVMSDCSWPRGRSKAGLPVPPVSRVCSGSRPGVLSSHSSYSQPIKFL